MTRVPTITDIARKTGSTGRPAFVTLTHVPTATPAPVPDRPDATRQNLAPDIVLTAIDSDVIKTYVELGLGVGIIASVAFDPERDRQLKCFEAVQLFPINTTRVAIRRGAYLRDFTLGFIESFAPDLTRERVIEAITSNRTAEAE